MALPKIKSSKKKYEDPGVSELRESLKSLSLVPEKGRKKKTFEESVSSFLDGLVDVLIKMKDAKTFRSLANMVFERLERLYPKHFTPLKNAVSVADMNILPESYIGLCFAVPFLVAASALGVVVVESIMLDFPPMLEILSLVFVPIILFAVTFFALYAYPFQKVSQKERSIDTNMAFAVNHLAAIASSGVPPKRAFEMISEFGEYGAVSIEAKNIVRRMEVFGEDMTQAISYIAKTTPSKPFQDLLFGMLSITQSGGNLKDYLNDVAALALFNYQLARKKYIETLSTYADIYTAILIAAPLFLVAILTVMNIIPGSLVGGLTVDSLMRLGVYVLIPGMNIAFLAFIAYTQPEI